MQAVTQHAMQATISQTRRFFDLPRELRDEIYKHCYQVIPHRRGALRRYADIPSSALLRTCKQIYQEASSVFHSGLEAVLLHDRVRFKLHSQSEGVVRHAGWQRITNERFDIWVRNGPEAETEVEWLVYLSPIWQGGVRDGVLEQSVVEILILSDKLHKLTKLFRAKNSSPIGRRLYSLQNRVSQVVMKLEEQEATRRAAVHLKTSGKELRESQSQPSGFDVQQEVGFVHDWRYYGAVPVREVRAQTRTGNGNQG